MLNFLASGTYFLKNRSLGAPVGHVRKLLIMTLNKSSKDIDNVDKNAIDDAVVDSVKNAIKNVIEDAIKDAIEEAVKEAIVDAFEEKNWKRT